MLNNVNQNIRIKDRILDIYLIIATFIIQLALSKVLRFLLSDDIVAILFLCTGFVLLTIIIIHGTKDIALIVMLAFLIRIALMFFDNHTLILSNFNGDSLGYFSSAQNLAINGESSYVYGGLYSHVLAFVLNCVGLSRYIAEYFNIVLNICFILAVYSSCVLLELSYKTIKLMTFLSAFFPYCIYNGVATYREGMVMTLVLLSFYYLIKWIRNKNNILAMLSLSLCCLACAFHSGIVPLLGGYAFIFAFYNSSNNRIRFRKDSLLMILILLIVFVIIGISYPQFFLGKIIEGFEDSTNIIKHFNYAYGGSRYLTWINAGSIQQVILFSPLKAFYLTFSPIPFDWRGIKDLIAFGIDSTFYIAFFYYTIKYRNKVGRTYFLSIMILTVIAVFFLFGIGTWTAGTAMRHRCKLLGILIVLLGYVLDAKNKTNEGI